MVLKTGQIVRPTAGRDAQRPMLIVGFDGKRALLCDGGERPLERPKAKNTKHLAATNVMLDMSQCKTNRSLKKALAALQRIEA